MILTPPATRHAMARLDAELLEELGKPKRAKPDRAEQRLHMDVARYLDYALPDLSFWSTLPSGGGGKVRGAILKRMGLRKGLPDLLCIQGCRVVFLELKTMRGVVSPVQRDCHDVLRNAGAWVFVCRSIDDVERALKAADFRLRARVAA